MTDKIGCDLCGQNVSAIGAFKIRGSFEDIQKNKEGKKEIVTVMTTFDACKKCGLELFNKAKTAGAEMKWLYEKWTTTKDDKGNIKRGMDRGDWEGFKPV